MSDYQETPDTSNIDGRISEYACRACQAQNIMTRNNTEIVFYQQRQVFYGHPGRQYSLDHLMTICHECKRKIIFFDTDDVLADALGLDFDVHIRPFAPAYVAQLYARDHEIPERPSLTRDQELEVALYRLQLHADDLQRFHDFVKGVTPEQFIDASGP